MALRILVMASARLECRSVCQQTTSASATGRPGRGPALPRATRRSGTRGGRFLAGNRRILLSAGRRLPLPVFVARSEGEMSRMQEITVKVMNQPSLVPSNPRVNPAHSGVTSPANGSRRRAAGRAGHARRWADWVVRLHKSPGPPVSIARPQMPHDELL